MMVSTSAESSETDYSFPSSVTHVTAKCLSVCDCVFRAGLQSLVNVRLFGAEKADGPRPATSKGEESHATPHYASYSNSLHGGLFRCDDGSPALDPAGGPSSVTARCGLAQTTQADSSGVKASFCMTAYAETTLRTMRRGDKAAENFEAAQVLFARIVTGNDW